MPKLGYDRFGFTWPLALDSPEGLATLQRRYEKAAERKEFRASWIKKDLPEGHLT